MAQVRVHNFSVSLDGFGTGEGQSLDAPFGHATGRLMEWLFATRTFHAMHDKAGGDTGVDEAFASNWGPGIGAEIMGRNKFGHSAARGRTTSGKGGGATTLSFILRSWCSPITQDHQSSWTAVQRSTSSTRVLPRPWLRRERPLAAWTSASAGARRSSASSWLRT